MKIVVIGAGVAGLAIAWRLAQAGQEVTLLERAQPGGGATWASAGMLAVTSELLSSGPEERGFARHSNSLWPNFAKEIEAASGHSIGYGVGGALLLGGDVQMLDRLARQAGSRPGLELVDAGRVREIAPLVTGSVAGGLWSPGEARVNNRTLGLAMAVAFQKAGGTLKPNEAVVRIERREGRAAVAHTPFGLHHADAFILAAGAWSGLLEEKLAPIVPVKGQMILLSPPRDARVTDCVIWGNGIYAVPRQEGLAVGATVEEVGFDTAITDEARDSLLSAAKVLMPGLKDWTMEDQWAGLRPKGPDGLPLLGPTTVPGLWLASGQYRNGILFAPAIAETMCRQLLGGPGIAAFDPPEIPVMSFALHPRLEADTHFAADWPLGRVLVMNDARYPWLILVPRREGVTEVTGLEPQDRTMLMDEITRAGRLIQALPGVAKLNLGALGNKVPQLHVHVIGRHPGDPAWPEPVWGHSLAVPYAADALARFLRAVRAG